MITQKIYVWDGINIDELILELANEIAQGYSICGMIPESINELEDGSKAVNRIRFILIYRPSQ